MWIVDYLISNPDRHGMNWGFFYDAATMVIKGCHPLYDHNNAFDRELMLNKDAAYRYNMQMTMKEAAQYAAKRVDFHFFDEIEKKDFLTPEQYESFCSRASDLGFSPTRSLIMLPMGLREQHAKEQAVTQAEKNAELTYEQPVKSKNQTL